MPGRAFLRPSESGTLEFTASPVLGLLWIQGSICVPLAGVLSASYSVLSAYLGFGVLGGSKCGLSRVLEQAGHGDVLLPLAG